MDKVEIGQLVVSKAGRDKGKHFLVADCQEDYLYLVDGNLRRLEKPKRKKRKHVRPVDKVSLVIREAIVREEKMNNAVIRVELKHLVEPMDD